MARDDYASGGDAVGIVRTNRGEFRVVARDPRGFEYDVFPTWGGATVGRFRPHGGFPIATAQNEAAHLDLVAEVARVACDEGLVPTAPSHLLHAGLVYEFRRVGPTRWEVALLPRHVALGHVEVDHDGSERPRTWVSLVPGRPRLDADVHAAARRARGLGLLA